MRAKLSLLAMYNYDSSLLDGLSLPTNLESERETIIDNLLLETAELEILYPEFNTMKSAIKLWSRKNSPVWGKLYKTTVLEYNPIWNKDATITETEQTTGNNTGSKTTEETINRDYDENSKTDSETSTTGNSTTSSTQNRETDDFVYGFNNTNPAQKSKTTETNTITGTDESTTSGDGTEKTDRNIDDDTKRNQTENSTGNSTGSRTYERRETGNIGITTTQQMINEEREVDQFNIIDYIVNDFKNRFCLLVY